MKKRHIQNELLDRVAGGLLEASRPQNDEIEKIVAAPHLFESVRARIEAEEIGRRSKRIFRTSHYILSWKSAAVAGILAIFFIGAVSLGVFTNKAEEPPVANHIQDQIEQPGDQPPTMVGEQPQASSKTETPPIHRRAVLKAKSKQIRVKRQPRVEREELSEFYAVTYAGDQDDADEGGQIVRVTLPRSSLFAMGIDLPMENESAEIRTDLLIGSDGVMRAVRIVN